MRAFSLESIGINTADLRQAEDLYTHALGFARIGGPEAGCAGLCSLLGARAITRLRLRRGRQVMELTQIDPPGAPYAPCASNDSAFQHCALVTSDMRGAYAALDGYACTPISPHGPQTLPGGIVAFKFRDPEGHPLELIQFPQPNPATEGGIDHSAIAVRDAGRSLAFYTATLGLAVAARQRNTGAAQDALDGLNGASAEIIALSPARPDPHVELLAYLTPPGRPARAGTARDIAATRLVLTVERLAEALHTETLSGGGRASLLHDPDGHAILLVERSAEPGAPACC